MAEKEKFFLRAITGVILLVLALAFLILKADNHSIEYIMLALAAFLVGGSFLPPKSLNVSGK